MEICLEICLTKIYGNGNNFLVYSEIYEPRIYVKEISFTYYLL